MNDVGYACLTGRVVQLGAVVLLLAACASGSGYDCDAAERTIRRQEQLVVPLIADLLAVKEPLNDCGSGGGGYFTGRTKSGVAIEEVAARLTDRGWNSSADKQGNPGALMLVGEVNGVRFEVYIGKRHPTSPVVEVEISGG